MLSPNSVVASTAQAATSRPFANLERDLVSIDRAGGAGDLPAQPPVERSAPPAALQSRLAEDAFRPGDRVTASANVEMVANRDDRVFVTFRFRGNPTPVAIDTVWLNCAACDLLVGDEIKLQGRVRRINHGGDRKWDTAAVLFDGLTYAVALPLSDIEPL